MLKAQPASDFRPQTAASTESRNSNCRQIVRNNSSRNDNNTVGGLYHPPSWRGHSSGQRQAAKADIAPAAPLQANHRSAEDCRASQGDPTDSDAPGNPTRKPGAGGGNTWQQKQQPQQQRAATRTTATTMCKWAVSSTFVALSWPRAAATTTPT